MLNITSCQNTHLNQLRALGPELRRVNGTLIHGMPMDERLLVQGDRILSVPEDEGLLSPLKPETIQAHLPTARMARDLKTLLRISTAINSMRSLETLQRKLLELIFEIIPGDRGAILLVG